MGLLEQSHFTNKETVIDGLSPFTLVPLLWHALPSYTGILRRLTYLAFSLVDYGFPDGIDYASASYHSLMVALEVNPSKCSIHEGKVRKWRKQCPWKMSSTCLTLCWEHQIPDLAARILVSKTVNSLPHIFFLLDHTAPLTEKLKIKYVSVEETQMFL